MINFRARGALTCLAVFSFACASQPPVKNEPSDSTDYAWIELSPDPLAPGSQQIVRVITHAASCPEIQTGVVAGASGRMHATVHMRLPMKLRSTSNPQFNVISCEIAVPKNARTIRVLGKVLPTLVDHPKRIAFIGDTGCRLKGTAIQRCNDENAWPFKKVMASVALWKPDLIVHVGDYYYRETPCPAGNPNCAGSPYGEKWETWREDFFAPADPAFGAAPWLMIRGNHENCERGGDGWARFLEPAPYSATCNDLMSPYPIELDDHRLWVIDSAQQKNIPASLNEISNFNLESKPTWIVTHRPFLDEKDGDTRLPPMTIRKGQLPENLELVLNGHFHMFRVNRFNKGLPPQVITGNGGTLLDKHDKQAVPSVISRWEFGFLAVEREGVHRWKLTEMTVDGKEVTSCTLTENLKSAPELDCPDGS